TLLLFAAAGAVSPGTAALAGTVTVDLITNNTTEARIGANAEVSGGDNPNAAQVVWVNASHQTNALTVAGSLAGAKTAGGRGGRGPGMWRPSSTARGMCPPRALWLLRPPRD